MSIRWWNDRARAHARSALYGRYIRRLRSGGSTLHSIEKRLAGPVANRDVLHLQCHIGCDSISWARLDAKVTAVDYSPESLALARELAAESDTRVDFVECDVLHARDAIPGEFDVVVATYGVLMWIKDVSRWAENAASMLRVGGRLVLVDLHPISLITSAVGEPPRVVLEHPYFDTEKPVELHRPGSYATQEVVGGETTILAWPHSLSRVVSSILDAGLILGEFEEHSRTPWPRFSHCLPTADDMFELPPPLSDRIPLLYSLLARRV